MANFSLRLWVALGELLSEMNDLYQYTSLERRFTILSAVMYTYSSAMVARRNGTDAMP